MYQAIVTKYLGPTNFKGSRVKAIAEAGSITLSWDCALNSDRNHANAAKALAQKYGWRGYWYSGALPNHSGYSFVCVTNHNAELGKAAMGADFYIECENRQ